MRYWSVILLMSTVAASAASGPLNAEAAAQGDRDGRSLFLGCEFKQATRAFEKALVKEPDNAALQYWLGKSYARLAEVSSPLSAPKNARKARRRLVQATTMDPRNEEYLQGLFEFYLDSPEWSHGGLSEAAALLERISSIDPAAEPRLRKQLTESRKEHSGPGWWIERTVLRTSGTIGYLVPQP